MLQLGIKSRNYKVCSELTHFGLEFQNQGIELKMLHLKPKIPNGGV